MTESVKKHYFSGVSRNTVLLAFTSLFADISTEMLYPVLPIYLTQTLHASGSVVGLVEGIAQATQNIVQGFSGWLSDKLQKRKSLALAGYFLSAMGKPLMGLAQTWPGVMGGRFLDRFGSGFRSAPRDALIASSVPEESRGRAFGLEGIGDNLGAFLGPLLTVVLLISLHIGIRSIFYLAVIPGLLAFLMVLLVKERHTTVTAKSKIDVNFSQFPKAYWKYLLVTALFGIGNSSTSFLQPLILFVVTRQRVYRLLHREHSHRQTVLETDGLSLLFVSPHFLLYTALTLKSIRTHEELSDSFVSGWFYCI